MERLPQLKNLNFLESQMHRFSRVKDIMEKIKEGNYNKFDQIEDFKKSNLLDKKSLQYSNRTSRLFSIYPYLNKNRQPNSVRKLQNQYLKKKVFMSKTQKIITDKNSFNEDINPPLNERYRSLISISNYNKRCFRNLNNKEFDSIFNELNISESPYNKKKILIPKSAIEMNKYKKINNLQTQRTKKLLKKKNKNYIISTVSNLYTKNNNFINRMSNKNDHYTKTTFESKNIDILNILNNEYDNENNKNKTLYRKYLNQTSNENEDKFANFLFLLKKQSDKNTKLLNDVKRLAILNKDILLASVVKLSGYKGKKLKSY